MSNVETPAPAGVPAPRPAGGRRPRLTEPQLELLTDIVTRPRMFLRRWSRWEKTGQCLARSGLASLCSAGPGHCEITVTQEGRAEAVRRGLVPADEVVTLVHGTERYAGLLSGLWENMPLVSAMWADTESRPADLDEPGTSWTVVLVAGELAAWCAARVIPNGTLKCHSNYEVRAHRGHGRYEAAYQARHTAVVESFAGPAVTYLFEQPIGLHEADGWTRTGASGPGEVEGHTWWELRRG